MHTASDRFGESGDFGDVGVVDAVAGVKMVVKLKPSSWTAARRSPCFLNEGLQRPPRQRDKDPTDSGF